MSNDAELIRRAGYILFGANWKNPFAKAFDLSPKTVRRLAADSMDCPGTLMAEVEQALRDMGQALDALLLDWSDPLPPSADHEDESLRDP